MSDVETEIREMLRRKADDALGEEALPSLPVARIARRRARNVGSALAGLVAIAIAAVAVAGGLGGPKAIEPIEPRPQIASLRLAEDASDVAVGFGSVWVSTDFSLVRVDPEGPSVVHTISCPAGLRPIRPPQPAPGSVKLLAVGADAVWLIGYRTPADQPCETAPRPTATVTTTQSNGSFGMSIGGATLGKNDTGNGWGLMRIDPDTNALSLVHGEQTGVASAIAATADAVWIAVSGHGEGEILKLDPKKRKVVARVPVAAEPLSIAADQGGVYVSLHHPPGIPDEVVKLDPHTAKIVASARHEVAGNIVARDGVVVLAGPREAGLAITGLDPDTLVSRQPYYVVPQQFAESDVDLAGGQVWIGEFTFERAFASIVYHGPADATGTLGKIEFDQPIDYLAAAEDFVWVVGNVNGYGTLFKIAI